MDINNSPLCKQCDAYQCKACKYINKHSTQEYLISSEVQCLISHCERSNSLKLISLLKEAGMEVESVLEELDYNDPMVKYNKLNEI